MKKLTSALSILLLLGCCSTALCSCESKAERDYRQAVEASKAAQKAADKARDDYNDLRDSLDNLKDAYSRLP